jgi:hypothetical protein
MTSAKVVKPAPRTPWQVFSNHSRCAVIRAIEILQDKFASIEDFGPRQVVEFFASPDPDTQSSQARRAFELVQKLLSLL